MSAPRRAQSFLRKTPSECRVVHSEIEVKFWAEGVPPAERVRPACCPRCGAAARPLGGRLGLVGHGLRDRQVRGLLEPHGIAGIIIVRVRRFRCLGCGAVITVVPRGVAARRHFGAGSLGLGLFLLGRGESYRKIRDRLGGLGPPEDRGWRTLRRWGSAAGRGALLGRLAAMPIAGPRKRAARVAGIIATYAALSLTRASLEAQVFSGAIELARAA